MATLRNVFYWNSSDNKDHTHKRIEWAIENGYLICININITDKLFNMVKKDDVILAYEPKYHKISKYDNGNDGYCMECITEHDDGLQAFTNAFTMIDNAIILNTFEEYEKYNSIIFRNWYSTIKHCKDINSCNAYFKTYFHLKGKIYLFPVAYSGALKQIISTNTKSNYELKYYGNIRKGFNIINDIYLNRLILTNKLF
jgi:hypothetical protein